MTPGIERIRITSDWKDWRTDIAEDMAPVADGVYRQVFAGIGLPLHESEQVTCCTKEQARARYDWQEGIDVILSFAGGGRATLQEKFLTYHTSTVTFEEYKTSGEPGAWFYCTAQYYFVGYARKVRDGLLLFQDWILLDLPSVRRMDGQQHLPWQNNKNKHDGRRATFRYLHFDHVPAACVVARYKPSCSPRLQVPVVDQLRLPF